MGDLVDRLAVHVQNDDEKGFIREIDKLFLGGSWGFLFEMLAKTPGGYHWTTFAADIRGLVWACLKRRCASYNRGAT